MAVRGSIIVLFGIVALASVCAREVKERRGQYSFVRVATKNLRLDSKSGYDYIIVGGGTAGCPLAATLSQKASVLLLERGGSPYENVNISRMENFHRNLLDFGSPHSPTQEFVSEDGVYNARGRVLGGGTSINAGFYTRASPQDIKALRLEPRLVNESYRWIEDAVVHRPARNEWQSAVAQGLVEGGVSPYNGFTYDHLPGTKVGGTIFNETGDRYTAADVLQYANPKKLTVLLYATVQRLLFVSKAKTRPKAYGVIFKGADGVEHRAVLKKGKTEIIISAGALGSPQLLMLSGIGPAEELKSLGIKVLINQPAVGKNLADNPMNTIWVPSPLPIQISLIQVVGITNYGAYIEASSGFGYSPKGIEQRGGFLLSKVAGPHSKGYLRLNNTNVDDNPVVRFNYFQHPVDLKRCVQGIRTMQKVIDSHHMKRFISPNLTADQLLNVSYRIPVNFIPEKPQERISVQQFCRDKVTTIWHYHGGCQVGSVVDREYRLIGVDGVRVIDGSTLLFSPGTNPQATVMMLGRYMGLRILRERLGPLAGV